MLNSVDFGINRVDAFSIDDVAEELNTSIEKVPLGEFVFKTCFFKLGEDKVKFV